MARLRQYQPNRYNSSEATQAEFENLVRYINSAELGNLTLRELLEKLFDGEGNVDLSIRFRYDAITGLEVSVGGDDEKWTTVVAADDIRGAPGVSLGMIDGPVYFNREDYVATAGQTVFDYVVSTDAADLVVYVGGLLQARNSYTYSIEAGQVTLAVAPATGAPVTIYSVRNNASSTYRRQDFVAGASQVVFPFPHTEDEYIQVYRNGILQREGASYDYIESPITGTVTMTTAQPANTIISVLVVQNKALRDVLGLMLEDRYATNGLIRYDRVAIADGQIPAAKIAALSATLDLKGDVYIGSGAPSGTVRAGSLLINTARPVPALMFYDGARWFDTSPEGSLPAPRPEDALRFLRLNSTATGYELVTLDLSGAVSVEAIGAASGVASLDANALVPAAQLPVTHRRFNTSGKVEGSISNGTKMVGVIGGVKAYIGAATYVLEAGSASVQLKIGGTNYGTAVAVGTVPVRQVWGSVVADALASGLTVSLEISAASSASGLAWNVQGSVISVAT